MTRATSTWATVFVSAVALVWIVPVVGIVVTSLRPLSEAALGWWTTQPFTLTLDAWRTVWTHYPLADAFWTTLKLAGLATLATMLLTPAAAYALHFLRFPLRRTIMVLVVSSFVLPQQVIVIPLFRLWRELGLIDHALAVLIPYVGLSFAWSIVVARNYLAAFPRELIDAARIDGCGPLAVFRHIVLPNMLAPMSAVGILQFLWSWNALLLPLLYLRTQVPLPVVFARLAGTFDAVWNLRAAAAIVTAIVPLVVFIVFQREFAGGALNRSGIKE
ncbi:carbohydrate ABC transporter permease [Paraburkholderia acidisoli]|uniref:sn-glycerol-3-phosphate transport system permease protein UgpE n=1 Tax=Paraburkholderia acidisoli TaxID=2571748 RepID=A0A7Z2GJV0_9BURK|nr:carbohydrate ABC transporter permease [Paraburkholderia acidisoli]QGZ63056.1 ABC transporter permease subunit [Paraburkholderia acidisoli]